MGCTRAQQVKALMHLGPFSEDENESCTKLHISKYGGSEGTASRRRLGRWDNVVINGVI